MTEALNNHVEPPSVRDEPPQSSSGSTKAYKSSTAQKLIHFHEHHFPGQQVPTVSCSDFRQEALEVIEDGEDDMDLGSYSDGVKKTLTDEQIRMFRHSEIQRLLGERRNAQRKRQRDRRKREKSNKNALRPPHFHADAAQTDAQIHTLQYDDEPSETITTHKQGESKFLWPVLRG